MGTIYIAEQGSLIKKRNRRLIVENRGDTVLDIPVIKVNRLFVFGNIQLTTQALTMLLENNVDIAFFTTRGTFKGKVVNDSSPNLFLRMAQLDRWKDENYRIGLCRSIVSAKLHNMITVLKKHGKNHPETGVDRSCAELEKGRIKLDEASTTNSIMGIEGGYSSIYFSTFARIFRRELQFEKRMKRPPPDPVNALLSLGYVMITNEIGYILEGMTFEPYLGFLHSIKYGRKSLALDMVEEFRQPVIDQFVLRLANLQIFKHEHFEAVPGKGVYLNESSFKKFLGLYDDKIKEEVHTDVKNVAGDGKNWRDMFRLQAGKLEKSIMNGDKYEPFLYR